MSLQEQKNTEEVATVLKPTDEEEEYDEYLLWPSLVSGNMPSGSRHTSSSPLYGPVSLHSESTEYEYSGFSSGPPSPITFAHTLDFRTRSPIEPDFGAASSPEPPKEQKSERAKYSPLFKLGFYLSQMNHFVNRAIDGVKLKTRKPRSQSAVSLPMGKRAPDL